MIGPRRILAILAHPDDESMGMGGVLARYSAEGVHTYVVTATRGERGRYFSDEQRPGPDVVGRTREEELRQAADVLGIREVAFLDYRDGELDRADPREAIGRISAHIRRIRPDVVLTFDPYGAYGHPDHIAICQLATAAVVAAADATYAAAGDAADASHRVAKLYYMAWDEATWAAYQQAFRRLVSRVDGAERVATPWPDWSVTTRIDTRAHSKTVWNAVRCHRTQVAIYGALAELSPWQHQALWGSQTFYRVFSLVNGGRDPEADLLEGLR